MIYLASPYSHPSDAVRYDRFLSARDFIIKRIVVGEAIFSPIVYCRQFEKIYQRPFDASAWWDVNRRWLEAANALWILRLKGWEDSQGIAQEIAHWYSLNRTEPEIVDA